MTDAGNDEHPVGLETRNIFLDAEVFRSNGHNLSTAMMKVLGDYLADGVLVLHTTDVTLREISRQICAMESTLTNRHNKVVRDLTRWNKRYRFAHHHLPVPDPLSEPAQPSSAFQDFARQLRHDWNAHEHTAAALPIGSVLDQYFSGQAPFDKEGSKEFPDAIALLALQAWCASARESIYVVSRDKAVQRAAKERDHLVAIESLDHLFALITAAESHNIAETIWAAFDKSSLWDELQDTLSERIDRVDVHYDGDKNEVDILAMELVEIEEIDNLTVLRVDQDSVSCLVRVQLFVSAEIDYQDVSTAIWDSEDRGYFGVKSVVTEIDDSITTRIFVQLKRDGQDVTLSSAQFIARELTVTDYFEDFYL